MERKAFAISFPSEIYVKEADYFGIVSGRKENKFSKARLTPVKSKLVDASFVKEFPVVLECRFIKKVRIGLHTALIGEILDVKTHRSILDDNKMPSVEKIRPLVWSLANMSYRSVGKDLGQSFSIGRKMRKRE
jgi:flavin reductase (DIM6/NTAB) family NADH-FMN oxidoreductase RutF